MTRKKKKKKSAFLEKMSYNNARRAIRRRGKEIAELVVGASGRIRFASLRGKIPESNDFLVAASLGKIRAISRSFFVFFFMNGFFFFIIILITLPDYETFRGNDAENPKCTSLKNVDGKVQR